MMLVDPKRVSYSVVSSTARIQHSGMANPAPTHAGDPALISIGQAIRDVRSEVGLSQDGLRTSRAWIVAIWEA